MYLPPPPPPYIHCVYLRELHPVTCKYCWLTCQSSKRIRWVVTHSFFSPSNGKHYEKTCCSLCTSTIIHSPLRCQQWRVRTEEVKAFLSPVHKYSFMWSLSNHRSMPLSTFFVLWCDTASSKVFRAKTVSLSHVSTMHFIEDCDKWPKHLRSTKVH